MAALLGRELATYTAGAMTYDLRRLRLHGIIVRAPGTQRYTLTMNGARAAFFYTALLRRLRQLPTTHEAHADHLPAPLRAALNHLDSALQQLWSPTTHAA